MKISSLEKPKEGSLVLGVRRGFLEEGMLKLEKGRRTRGTRGRGGLGEGVCGAVGVMLGTDKFLWLVSDHTLLEGTCWVPLVAPMASRIQQC